MAATRLRRTFKYPADDDDDDDDDDIPEDLDDEGNLSLYCKVRVCPDAGP